MWFAYSIPLVIVLAVGAGLRVFAGPERTARLSGLPVGLGVLIGIFLLVDPALIPKSAHDRISHIVLGAIIVGVAFDTLVMRPLWRGILLGVFIVGCAWLSVVGGVKVRPTPTLGAVVAGTVWAATWLATVVKSDALRSHPPTAQTIVTAGLVGVFAIAMTAGDATAAKAALAALSAWVGLAAMRLFVAMPVAWAGLLPVLATIFAGAWAMATTRPVVAPGLAVLLFILFADRTAQRVPMPGGRISDVLYVLALAGMAAIPIVFAVAIVAARL